MHASDRPIDITTIGRFIVLHGENLDGCARIVRTLVVAIDVLEHILTDTGGGSEARRSAGGRGRRTGSRGI